MPVQRGQSTGARRRSPETSGANRAARTSGATSGTLLLERSRDDRPAIVVVATPDAEDRLMAALDVLHRVALDPRARSDV